MGVGGVGAVIGNLMQRFFISLHLAFKRLSVLFVLDAGLFYRN